MPRALTTMKCFAKRDFVTRTARVLSCTKFKKPLICNGNGLLGKLIKDVGCKKAAIAICWCTSSTRAETFIILGPVPQSPTLAKSRNKPKLACQFICECEMDSLPKRLHCEVENQTNGPGSSLVFRIVNRDEECNYSGIILFRAFEEPGPGSHQWILVVFHIYQYVHNMLYSLTDIVT